MMDDFPEGWVEAGRFASEAVAERHALVLVAVGIDCRIWPLEDGGALLLVPAREARRARQELVEYAGESRRPRPEPAPHGLGEGVLSALAYASLLLLLDAAARAQAFGFDWLQAGMAQAGRILAGEWWRTVTALGLHADFGHLIGNMAAGGLFGALLVQLLGVGLAWLAILLAGAAGNGLNALIQPADHAAIGASTAVFAALGMLSALTWRREAPFRPHRARRLLPLAAGIMLLAFLGMGGERTDIVAHGTGFAAGVAAGAALAHAGRRVPQGPGAQRAYAAAALALVALAWALALQEQG